MIGIAVCYTNEEQFSALCRNIGSTCGADRIICGVDNRDGTYDIFSAYEKMAGELNTEITVFCHQDILFHTADWGVCLERYFAENPQLGAVGVAGGSAHSVSPGGWMTAPPLCSRVINIIQHFPGKTPVSDCTVSLEKSLYPVAAVDGVFIAIRQEALEKISFSASGLKGYHGYDLDISLQLLRNGWKIAVTSEILLEHFSAGTYSPQYIRNIAAVHRQYRDILPVFTDHFPCSQRDRRKYETCSLLFFAYTMREAGVPSGEFRRLIREFLPAGTLFCKSAILLLKEYLLSFVRQ